LASGVSATIAGSGDIVTASAGGVSVALAGSGSGAADHASFAGAGDLVEINDGVNALLSDGGSGLRVVVLSSVGVDTLSNFGADSTGIIDLFSGAGGYATAAAAFAALTSDGAGGEKLSLGGANYIDFANDTSLTVNNFKIA